MGKVRSLKRAARRETPTTTSTRVSETEIIDLWHPLVTEAMVKKLLPDGVSVPIGDLQRVCYLATHPIELDQVPPAETKAIGAKFNELLNQQFRAAQERHLKERGVARPK